MFGIQSIASYPILWIFPISILTKKKYEYTYKYTYSRGADCSLSMNREK